MVLKWQLVACLCGVAAAQDAVPSVLQWLLSMGHGSHIFPLMDFVTSEMDEIDTVVGHVGLALSSPCGQDEDPGMGVSVDMGCTVVQRIQALAERLAASAMPNKMEEAALAEWVLQLDWLSLVTRPMGQFFFRRLEGLAAARRSASGGSSSCDLESSPEDLDFIDSVHRSLEGVETLPLERNEFKWADFFLRHTRKLGFCTLGVATLFLVAGDITAYASAAVGGEHHTRLERALRFAQGIARSYVTGVESEDSLHLELFQTSWPIWRLLASISAELAAGSGAEPSASTAWSPGLFQHRHVLGAYPWQDAEEPYLSIIVQSRNDDYGGGMLTRLNRMLSTATYMLHEAGLPAEIIVVEWNPPVSTVPLSTALSRAPGTEQSVPIRVIRVPPEVHARLPHHKAHPIFEHIAENVAFRRARGRFFLKTNIDNILSPDTVMFLRKRQLRKDAVYRATYMEYDVDQPENAGFGPKELLEWLFSQSSLLNDVNLQLAELSAAYPEDTMVCRSGHSGAAADADADADSVPEQRPFYWAGSGDFVLASRELVHHVHGYPQIAQNWQTDDLIHCRLRAAGATQVVLQPPCATIHQNHRRINRVRSSTRWVVTDGNFQEICNSPFEPLPTETGLGDDWGFSSSEFEEVVL